jgi:two-component system, NtrC family, nitrogen regulation response regulator NtrX
VSRRRADGRAGQGAATKPEASAGPIARPRILLCDDDQPIRDSLAEALASEAFEVDTAERAVDAIQKVMRASYGALLLDLKLPGLGGLDAISVIKRFDEGLPIIVMTGHASYETEQAARAAGIFYYLVKPFSLTELTSAVKAAVRAREAGRSRT